MINNRKIEEVLEKIWTVEEETGEVKTAAIQDKTGGDPQDNLLDYIKRKGFIDFDNNTITLTQIGRKHSELIIRRHRLAERLLHDVLDFSDSEYESSACQFEHFIGDDVVASICTLLGHPNYCPHGRIIPKGECCIKTQKDIKSLISPLSEMTSGDSGKVVYIDSKAHDKFIQISEMGIHPGIKIRIHQESPLFVVQMEESQIALNKDLADYIYVRRKHH